MSNYIKQSVLDTVKNLWLEEAPNGKKLMKMSIKSTIGQRYLVTVNGEDGEITSDGRILKYVSEGKPGSAFNPVFPRYDELFEAEVIDRLRTINPRPFRSLPRLPEVKAKLSSK